MLVGAPFMWPHSSYPGWVFPRLGSRFGFVRAPRAPRSPSRSSGSRRSGAVRRCGRCLRGLDADISVLLLLLLLVWFKRRGAFY